MPLRQRRLICLVLAGLSAVALRSQTSAPQSGSSTLKTTARLVVVDVVVTDWYGQPMPGLRKEDFHVSEDGKPQTISAFEEHTAKIPAAIKQAALPPNTFSNLPRLETPDSLNVVLLDALNTPIQDQGFVHQQILKHLADMHPGEPIAVFIISTRLRLVHGFTSDLSTLLAALNDKKSRSGPQASPLLRSGGEIQAENQLASQMESLALLDPDIQAAMDSLRQFLAESAASQTTVRVQTTLSEMRQLAQFLSAFPGRKNVVWFSGAFPLRIFKGSKSSSQTDSMEDRGAEEDLRNTADALTKARVAIYPVEAGGLAADSLFDAGALPAKISGAREATAVEVGELQTGSLQRTANQATMDELAHDTGGQSFYNTNGLDLAMARAMHDGARYYTLAYAPTNKQMNGRFRRIRVDLTHGHYKLAYRRGYNADDEQTARAVADKLAASDPLLPLMAAGLPNFAQILYLMSVNASAPQPELTAQRAGDNAKLEGPFTRMEVNLAVSEKTLALEATPDGIQHGNLEVALVVYDRYGNQMNWLVRKIELSLSPEQYKAYGDTGLQFQFAFDAPRGAAYLRSGVCDLASRKAGTLEVPLSAPPAMPQEAKSN